MLIILCAALLLAVLYVLSLRGRTGHKGLDFLRGYSYAHRGLHGNGIPENSMAAFRAALEHGYGIELDIHLMQDGNLAVIHDPSLNRTAGADVRIEDLNAADLEHYPLEGTEEKIPLFPQILKLYAGKAPLIIELKPERSNHAALVDAAVQAMEGYNGAWCMESFDPRCIHLLRKKYPHIIRGQLSENFVHNPKSPLSLPLKWVMTHLLTNFLTRPDFIAYKYADRQALSVGLCRKVWKLQGVSWTLQSQEEYDTAVKEGYLPIFEHFCP